MTGKEEIQKDWFKDWFNTPYYHILYKNRNNEEAALFIRNLVQFLEIDSEKAKILDLACGKGRHSIYMNSLGFDVKGVDLSEESIQYASQFANDHLSFAVQDMREPIQEKFTHIFNLFTSFGYFDSQDDNQKVMHAIDSMLDKDGILVIDFMNSQKVIQQLVKEEEKTIDSISFHITREHDHQHIYKHIRFKDKEQDFRFSERVQALTLDDFSRLTNATGLQIIRTFGDFSLNPYHPETSDRLIIIAKKQE